MKLSICLFMVFLLASVVLSIPDRFSIQGQLKDSNSIALVGSYNMTFYIYDAYTSGNVLWQQSSNVTTDNNGIYTVILQNTNLTFNAPYYLATKVAADAEMSPRLNMSSSGYAVRANVSDSLNSGGTYYATAYYQGANKVLDSSGFAGENITSGTVADARIAATIARDTETNTANTSMKNYVDLLFALRLTNHSDASLSTINASVITVAGYSVCTYAGLSAANLTSGNIADARASSTLYTYLGGWKLTNFTTAFANSGAWKAANNSLDLKNHSDASIPNINVSSITVAGIPVATYAGFAGENITSGIVADARIAATLARDSEVDTVNATQKTYIDTNDALRLMNHSDASIRIVNASSVTIAGVPVATYAGISAGNLTSGTIDDIRISTTITRDTELTSYITNLTDTNFTKTCWGPVCTWYNYTMGALVTQVT